MRCSPRCKHRVLQPPPAISRSSEADILLLARRGPPPASPTPQHHLSQQPSTPSTPQEIEEYGDSTREKCPHDESTDRYGHRRQNNRSCQLRIGYFTRDGRGPQWQPGRAYTFPGTTLYPINRMAFSYMYFVLKKKVGQNRILYYF